MEVLFGRLVRKVQKSKLVDFNLAVIDIIYIHKTINNENNAPPISNTGCYTIVRTLGTICCCIIAYSYLLSLLPCKACTFLTLFLTFCPAAFHASLPRSLDKFLLLIVKRP